MKRFRFPVLGYRFSILDLAFALAALSAACGDDKSSGGSDSVTAEFSKAATKFQIKECTASFACYQDSNNAAISILGLKSAEDCSVSYKNVLDDRVLRQIGCSNKEFEQIATGSLASYVRCVDELDLQPNAALCGYMKPTGTGFYQPYEPESFVHKIASCQEAYRLIADGHAPLDGSCLGNLPSNVLAPSRR